MKLLLLACLLATALLSGGSAAAAEPIGDYTNMSYDSGHGTQIEYLSKDGRAFLWYPGNTVILSGRWKQSGKNMCFAYSEASYNPVTGAKGGAFECMPYTLWWGSVEQRMKGDVLGLKGRAVAPFRLPKPRTTLEKVLARVVPGAPVPELEVPVVRSSGTGVALSCSSIVANEKRSKADAAEAAFLYFHGQFMGKRCVAVDYARAFALAKEANIDTGQWLRILRERASTGNPKAIAALKLLDTR